MANKEDQCKGTFFEGRFKSIAILDKEALLTTLAYVDLNLVAAGMAKTPEDPAHTSVKARVDHCREQGALGKVVVNVEFPFEVTLTSFKVHSEHSGQYNSATNVVVETVKGASTKQVADSPLTGADAEVNFPAASSRKWRLTLQTGKSGKVCLRGLEFFNGQTASFPPPVPYRWEKAAAR